MADALRHRLGGLAPEQLVPLLARYGLVITPEARMDDIVGALASEIMASGESLESLTAPRGHHARAASTPANAQPQAQPHGPQPPTQRGPLQQQQPQQPPLHGHRHGATVGGSGRARPQPRSQRSLAQQQRAGAGAVARPPPRTASGRSTSSQVPDGAAANLSRFTEDQLLQHARDLGYVPDDSWTREVAERTLMQHYIDAHHKANEAEAGIEMSTLAAAQHSQFDYEDEYGRLYFLDPDTREYVPYPEDQQPVPPPALAPPPPQGSPYPVGAGAVMTPPPAPMGGHPGQHPAHLQPQGQSGLPPQAQGGYPPHPQSAYPHQQGGYPQQGQGGYPPQPSPGRGQHTVHFQLNPAAMHGSQGPGHTTPLVQPHTPTSQSNHTRDASMSGAYPRRQYDSSFFYRNDTQPVYDRFMDRGDDFGFAQPGYGQPQYGVPAPGYDYGGGYPGYPGYPDLTGMPTDPSAMFPDMDGYPQGYYPDADAELGAGANVVNNPMTAIAEDGTAGGDASAGAGAGASGTGGDAETSAPANAARRANKSRRHVGSSKKLANAASSARLASGRMLTWAPPSLDKARAYAHMNQPMELLPHRPPRLYNVCGTKLSRHCCSCCPDICCEGNTSRLLRYGSGVTNWFKMLKVLGWTFTLMSLIAVPSLVLNTFGNSEATVVDVGLSSTTIGNLGDSVNITRIYIPSTTCGDSECSISKADAAELYAGADLLYSILFMAAFLWLQYFERREGRLAKRKIITVDDYSVVVEWVPPDTTPEDVRKHFEDVTLGHKVQRVDIAENNSWLIRLYMRRGQLLKRLADAYDRVLRLEHEGKDCKKAKAARDKIIQKQKELDSVRRRKQVARGDGIALKAFVTFASEDGRVTALQLYPKGFTAWLCQRRKLRFSKFDGAGQDRVGKPYRIRVRPAPTSSTVLWENLTYGYCNRLGRRIVSTSVALLCIVLSTLLVFWASYRQAQAQAEGGDVQCQEGINYALSGSDTDPGTLHCYCKALGTGALTDEACRQWSIDQSFALALSYASSVTLVVVNGLLNVIMKKLAFFERHHSINDREVSFSGRLFLCLFINTSVIVVLVNARLQGLESLQASTYQDFVTDWYAAVGSSIMLTMMLNSVSLHFAPVLRYTWREIKLKCWTPNSQRQLNEWALGPDFHISIRYAQTMNTVFTCLAFSSGMPLMLPIAAFSFFIAYWVDKWLFLRFYRIPPQYGTELGASHTERLPYGILLHLAIGVWMLGNASIFQTAAVRLAEVEASASFSDAYIDLAWGERVSQRHVLPMFLVLVGVLAVLLLTSLCACARLALFRCVSLVTCGNLGSSQEGDEFRESHALPSYDQAVEDHLMQGIPTFNILQNPIYARAFAISAAFAASHSRVASVKHFRAVSKTKSQRRRDKYKRQNSESGSARQVPVPEQRRSSVAALEAQAKVFQSQRHGTKASGKKKRRQTGRGAGRRAQPQPRPGVAPPQPPPASR